MTNEDMFDEVFPQDKQIGGSHYKFFTIQPYEFIAKNDLTFFQGLSLIHISEPTRPY